MFDHPGKIIIGDCYDVVEHDLRADYCFLDPPYDNEAVSRAWKVFSNSASAVTCFLYPELIPAAIGAEQICHWVKPISTKNTAKKYSRFVEAIAVKHGPYFNQDLHWSTRTGVFTDTLIEKQIHPHQKPFSLVEKLVLLHTPPGGTVLDPFCGSRVVKAVCDKHGFQSLSIDVTDWVGAKTTPDKRELVE